MLLWKVRVPPFRGTLPNDRTDIAVDDVKRVGERDDFEVFENDTERDESIFATIFFVAYSVCM